MGLLTFKGGVHPNDGKSLAKDKAIVELLPQGDLVYPLSQHIGAPATALVKKGDQVVTSYVSDKFLQGILIGYVSETEMDSNNITKSGTITPAADFEHLREVLVILDKKTDATSDTEK